MREGPSRGLGARDASSAPAGALKAREPHRVLRLWPILAAALLGLALVSSLLTSAPVGEPVADDLTFLAAGLRGDTSLLSGGGSQAFWRPIPHQLYYGALAPHMLDRPIVSAFVNAAALTLFAILAGILASLVVSVPMAAVVTFCTIVNEYSRAMIAWPSHFVELSMLVALGFAALAASRGWFARFLIAGAVALLCKEVSAVYLLVFFVGRWLLDPRATHRAHHTLAFLLMTGTWLVTYGAVARSSGLAPPGVIATDPAVIAQSLGARALWSAGRLLGFASSADGSGTVAMSVIPWIQLAMLAAGLMALGSSWRRISDAAVRGTLLLALVCLGIGIAAMIPTFPIWAPHRAFVTYAALLTLAVAGLARLHRLAPLLLIATATSSLLASQPAPREIGVLPPTADRFIDFPRLVRLQRFMRSTRTLLAAEAPRLQQGSIIAQRNFPIGLSYALSGDDAVQVWCRDSSLRWIGVDELEDSSTGSLAGVVDFSPDSGGRVTLIPAPIYRQYASAVAALRDGDVITGHDSLSRVLDWSTGQRQAAFTASARYWRAVALVRMSRPEDALEDATAATRSSLAELDARFLRALILADMGRTDEARLECRTLLALQPGHREAGSLLRALE